MQLRLIELEVRPVDYSQSNVSIPLSGGINSAAVLCFLGEYHPAAIKPRELHLYYSHFAEHSPDTFKFVKDCMHYARVAFPDVRLKITRHSVNRFFIARHIIPHPTISPCSIELKVKPRERYDSAHGIDYVLVGFVRHEMRRYRRQLQYGDKRVQYPLLGITDEDCFALVKRVIGWYPDIYDIRENGKRVFPHNNCLPCKNMTKKQLESVGRYFPAYAQRAEDAAAQIPGGYWGRDDVPDVFKCDSCTRYS